MFLISIYNVLAGLSVAGLSVNGIKCRGIKCQGLTVAGLNVAGLSVTKPLEDLGKRWQKKSCQRILEWWVVVEGWW